MVPDQARYIFIILVQSNELNLKFHSIYRVGSLGAFPYYIVILSLPST